MNPAKRIGLAVLVFSCFEAACSSDVPTLGPVQMVGDAGTPPGDGPGADGWTSPVEAVPASETLHGKGLSAPIDIVRDEWGIPHIYGETLPDVAYGQGYIVARDRFIQMDLARHQASGTIAELAGGLSASTLDGDVAIRAHHLRKTAQDGFDLLRASDDPRDKAVVALLGSFAAGVNAYLDAVKAGQIAESDDLSPLDDFTKAAPWTEVDSLSLGQLQAFNLAFDASSEIAASLIDAKSAMIFDSSTDPALAARKGLGDDLQILAPEDPTFTIDGWTTKPAPRAAPHVKRAVDTGLVSLLEADRASVAGLGNDHTHDAARGSNNWVIGPDLSATGNPLVANDTHLALGNPSTFYLVHLSARSGTIPVDTMGVAFPGIPGVILGMNEHVAWGATVNNIDVTDVYQETIVTCDDGQSPCVLYKGSKVALVPRVETFNIGSTDGITKTLTLTLYDVPHHGPIIPRVTATHDGLEPLGSTELSVRYTGHEPGQLARAQIGLDASASMEEFVAALDRDFKYGGQNWVVADDKGHFGWTESVRVPLRAAGHAPWKVLPGDGSAEWGQDMDLQFVPHAFQPAKGFIATANNDPVGVTADGDPFNEPLVNGAPYYLAAHYDPGTRVGRITKRIEAMTAGGKKLSLDDLQAIQADAVTEWGKDLFPILLDAATSLAAEIATPGSHPELATVASGASSTTRALVPAFLPALSGWTFDTPSGSAEDAPNPQQISDSQATLVMGAWLNHFYLAALSDEFAKLGVDVGAEAAMKLFIRGASHPELLKSGIDPTTHDAVFFDDLTTPEVESKRQISAKALVAALDDLAMRLGPDATSWRWGQIHTLTLRFAVSFFQALQVPLATDPMFPNGFPRHGWFGTVDVANILSPTDFTYSSGPAIRFVCELDPKTGPRARNALPGGEQFDPKAPHYRDQMELWRKNQTFDLAFQSADVVKSALVEQGKNKLGRIRVEP